MEFRSAVKQICATLMAIAATTLCIGPAADAKRPHVSPDLITPGTLLVGSDIPYPPFEVGSGPGYRGFDIDLVNAMARKLDLRVIYKDTSFETIFTDLSKGKFDLVASATTITPERSRVVRFTKPNYDAQQSLVVLRGSSIRSIRDLRGVKVGAQNGTTGKVFARDETKAARVVGFANSPASFRALKRGRVAAVITDLPTARDAIARMRGIKSVQEISVGERYGYAVKKSSTRLLRGMNWAFGKIRADGTFKRVYRKWFGINPPPSLRS